MTATPVYTSKAAIIVGAIMALGAGIALSRSAGERSERGSNGLVLSCKTLWLPSPFVDKSLIDHSVEYASKFDSQLKFNMDVMNCADHDETIDLSAYSTSTDTLPPISFNRLTIHLDAKQSATTSSPPLPVEMTVPDGDYLATVYANVTYTDILGNKKIVDSSLYNIHVVPEFPVYLTSVITAAMIAGVLISFRLLIRHRQYNGR